jgi:HEAT repeat protein
MLTPIETAARPGMSAVRTNEADTFATAKPATPTDLIRQLRDASEEMRTRALYRSLAEGVPLATEILRRALADPSEGVRLLALEALAERPDGLVYVTDALRDASPHIRARAQQILNTQRRPR